MSFRVLLVLSFLLTSFISFAQNEYHVIAVGFYNCENFFDPVDDSLKKDEDFTPKGAYHYTNDIYKQKQHNIATVIEKMGIDITPDGPAILGLVEIENNVVLNDLIAQPEISRRKYQYCWFPTPDERGISTALLYNPRYFIVLGAQPIHVPLETLGQKRATRDVLYVVGVLSADTVHVLVNHWPSKYGGAAASEPGRRLAAQVDKRIVDSLLAINPRSKILIMGDLNDNPTSDGVVKVLQAKSDREQVSLRDLYNPWINMFKKGMGTESYRGQWNLLDQVMLSGNWLKNENNKWKYYNAEIFNKPFLTNKIGEDRGLPHRSFTRALNWDNGYSDHFPVLVYFVERKQ